MDAPANPPVEALLGLPLERALERARAAGVAARIVETLAPRRPAARGAEPPREEGPRARRVVRVRRDGEGVELTVSAFMDGTPRK